MQDLAATPAQPYSQRALAVLRRLGQHALDVIYPPTCLTCPTATGHVGALCPACWEQVRFIERPFCERLGTPFSQALAPGLLSPEAMAHPPVFDRARAVARFEDGPARKLIHRLKYGDRLDVADAMGLWMARAGQDLLSEAELLVPVPLHPRRLWARRFNQAAVLALVVTRHSAVPCDLEALVRVKAAPPQVGLSRLQRAHNLQGALRVPEAARPRVTGRRIVLVDDVLTSGATTNAAARSLLKAGAAHVDVLVFARVVQGA